MDSGLIFHYAVDSFIIRGEFEDDHLEATGSSRSCIIDFQFPSPLLCELGIHPEQVACKDGSLVATGTAADLNDSILGVIRISRDEEYLYLFLELRQQWLYFSNLCTGHLPEVLILLIDQDILCLCEFLNLLLIVKSGLDDRLQLLVVLVELDVFLHVGDHRRIRKLSLQRIVFVLESQDLVYQSVLCHIILLRVPSRSICAS